MKKQLFILFLSAFFVSSCKEDYIKPDFELPSPVSDLLTKFPNSKILDAVLLSTSGNKSLEANPYNYYNISAFKLETYKVYSINQFILYGIEKNTGNRIKLTRGDFEEQQFNKNGIDYISNEQSYNESDYKVIVQVIVTDAGANAGITLIRKRIYQNGGTETLTYREYRLK